MQEKERTNSYVSKYKIRPVCPHCKQEATLVGAEYIYPHREDLAGDCMWLCEPCDAYVSCHKKGAWFFVNGVKHISDGTLPKGTLANGELRFARKRVHNLLDPLWRYEDDKQYARKTVYKWLSNEMKLPYYDTHVGFFDVAQCQQALEILKKRTAGNLSIQSQLRIQNWNKR